VRAAALGCRSSAILSGLREADLRRQTGASLTFAPDCRPLTAPPIELPAADRA
jgi:hypothetical protein